MTALAQMLRQRAVRRAACATVDCGALGQVEVRALSPMDYAALALRGDRAVLYAACPALQQAGETLRREGAVFALDEIMGYVTDQEARLGAAAVADLSGAGRGTAAASQAGAGPVGQGGSVGGTRMAEQEEAEDVFSGAGVPCGGPPGPPLPPPAPEGEAGEPDKTATETMGDAFDSGVRTKENADSGGVGSDAGPDCGGPDSVRTEDRSPPSVRTDGKEASAVRTDENAEIRLGAVQGNGDESSGIRLESVQDAPPLAEQKIRPAFVRQAVQEKSGQVSREFFEGAGQGCVLPEMPETSVPSKLPKLSEGERKSQLLGQNGQKPAQHLAGPHGERRPSLKRERCCTKTGRIF